MQLLDAAGLLRRHDYTADVIGGWATAANRCLASEVVDDLRFYTRRLVTPRFGDHLVLPGPTLVWIELDDTGARAGRRERMSGRRATLVAPKDSSRASRPIFLAFFGLKPLRIGHKKLSIR